jgi:hypothetical protein
MPRFLIYSLILCVVCILLVGASRWVGAHQPQSAIVEGLRLTDCALPCWIGITPGQTTMEEAYQRLVEKFLYTRSGNRADAGRFQNLHFVVPVMNTPVRALPVNIQAVEGRVALMQLVITDRRRLTFADIILTYGAPTCVLYTESPVFIGWKLYYETSVGVAEIDAYGSGGDSIDQALAVYSIVLRGSDSGSACFFRDGETLPRWRGFGPRSRYALGQV